MSSRCLAPPSSSWTWRQPAWSILIHGARHQPRQSSLRRTGSFWCSCWRSFGSRQSRIEPSGFETVTMLLIQFLCPSTGSVIPKWHTRKVKVENQSNQVQSITDPWCRTTQQKNKFLEMKCNLLTDKNTILNSNFEFKVAKKEFSSLS